MFRPEICQDDHGRETRSYCNEHDQGELEVRDVYVSNVEVANPVVYRLGTASADILEEALREPDQTLGELLEALDGRCHVEGKSQGVLLGLVLSSRQSLETSVDKVPSGSQARVDPDVCW